MGVRRDASKGYVYPRCKSNRWEPGYAPLGTGRLSLGSYKEEEDAQVVLKVAQFYFEATDGVVDFPYGFKFPIPPLSEDQRNSTPEKKREWVQEKAREVLELYSIGKKSRGLVGTENSADDISRKLQVSQGDPRFISDPPPSAHGESASGSGEQQTPRLPGNDTPNNLDLGPVLGTGTSARSEERGDDQVLVQEEHIAGRDVPLPWNDTPNSLDLGPVLGTGTSARIEERGSDQVLVQEEHIAGRDVPLDEQNSMLMNLIVKGLHAGSPRTEWEQNCLLKGLYETIQMLNGEREIDWGPELPDVGDLVPEHFIADEFLRDPLYLTP